MLFSVESFLQLVQFLHLNGYIPDLAAFLLVLIGLGVMIGVIYVLIYTLKDSIERRSKDMFYLLVGVTTWIFTWLFTDIFFFAIIRLGDSRSVYYDWASPHFLDTDCCCPANRVCVGAVISEGGTPGIDSGFVLIVYSHEW